MKLHFRIIDRCCMIYPDIWDSDSPEDQVAKYESQIAPNIVEIYKHTQGEGKTLSFLMTKSVVEEIASVDSDKFEMVEDWPVKVEVFDSEDAREPIAVAELHKKFYYKAEPLRETVKQ